MVNLVTLVGTLAFVGGGLGYLLFPMGIKLGIGYFLNLSEDGLVYPTYMNPPFKPASRFWIYAVKNPK